MKITMSIDENKCFERHYNMFKLGTHVYCITNNFSIYKRRNQIVAYEVNAIFNRNEEQKNNVKIKYRVGKKWYDHDKVFKNLKDAKLECDELKFQSDMDKISKMSIEYDSIDIILNVNDKSKDKLLNKITIHNNTTKWLQHYLESNYGVKDEYEIDFKQFFAHLLESALSNERVNSLLGCNSVRGTKIFKKLSYYILYTATFYLDNRDFVKQIFSPWENFTYDSFKKINLDEIEFPSKVKIQMASKISENKLRNFLEEVTDNNGK